MFTHRNYCITFDFQLISGKDQWPEECSQKDKEEVAPTLKKADSSKKEERKKFHDIKLNVGGINFQR